jgi:hypothetical protein
MNIREAQGYINRWFASTRFLDLPLLAVEPDGVTPVIQHGRKSRLLCSDPLINAIESISDTIIADWNAARLIEGIAYLIYSRNLSGLPEPLYVGIANSANKAGTNFSALWKTRGARFCDRYDSNGHVDCLSRSLLEKSDAYAPWVASLFGSGYTTGGGPAPQLLRPVYVHLEVWRAAAHRVIPEVSGAPLFVEEMLRLWVLKAAGLGPNLLNRKGN